MINGYDIKSLDSDFDKLKSSYLYACSKDIEVIKPGNVYIDSPHKDTSSLDYLRSAHDSSKILFNKDLSFGNRVYLSVKETRKNTHVNTNLGIILLVAPIVQAFCKSEKKELSSAINHLVKEANYDDTKYICKAINLANPGGLGARKNLDTRSLPDVKLLDIMSESSKYDRISYQYTRGFEDILRFIVPNIIEKRKSIENTDVLLSIVFLETLAEIPDTHIWRKFGEKIAKKTSNQASDLIKIILKDCSYSRAIRQICALDYEYKNKGINPGTTADLLLASIMIERVFSLSHKRDCDK